jgi:hypothetical protein
MTTAGESGGRTVEAAVGEWRPQASGGSWHGQSGGAWDAQVGGTEVERQASAVALAVAALGACRAGAGDMRGERRRL